MKKPAIRIPHLEGIGGMSPKKTEMKKPKVMSLAAALKKKV